MKLQDQPLPPRRCSSSEPCKEPGLPSTKEAGICLQRKNKHQATMKPTLHSRVVDDCMCLSGDVWNIGTEGGCQSTVNPVCRSFRQPQINADPIPPGSLADFTHKNGRYSHLPFGKLLERLNTALQNTINPKCQRNILVKQPDAQKRP